MNIELEDGMVAAGALRDMARASVKEALKQRIAVRRKKGSKEVRPKFNWLGKRILRFAKEQGMAARRIQAAVNAEMKRLTTP